MELYDTCIMISPLSSQYQLIFIFVAVMCGVLSTAYFYISTNVFMDLLKRPLKLISTGMTIMTIDVLLAAFITYESSLGMRFSFFGLPLEAIFFVFYIIGSVLIGVGARQFTHRPA